MRQLCNPSAVAIRPAAAAPGTAGWAQGAVAGVSPGTVIDEDVFNSQQAEFLALLTAAGLAPDPTNDTQLLTAVRSLVYQGGYASDTGAANAYVMAPASAVSAYAAGQGFVFKAANASTGASTLNISGLGAKSIKRQDGSALQAGDIVAGQMVAVQYDGTNFQLLTEIWSLIFQGTYAPDTGAANAYVVAVSSAVSAYAAGQGFVFKAANACTGASTLNVNGLGTKSIKRPDGAALQAGDVVAGQMVLVRYDGTNFQLAFALTEVTAPANDNTTKRANTAWVWTNIQALVASCIGAVATAAGLAYSFGSSGYVFLPSWLGSFGIQWGSIIVAGGSTATPLTFPTSFPTQCYAATFGYYQVFQVAVSVICMSNAQGQTSSCSLWTNQSSSTYTFNWIAVGK